MANNSNFQRFACFRPEEQAAFDRLPALTKRFVLLRSQGYEPSAAYVKAGGKDTPSKSAAANMQQVRHPEIKGLIAALTNQRKYEDIGREGTASAKEVDKIAEKNLPVELLKNLPSGATDVDLSKLTPEQAADISFYRQVAEGKIFDEQETLEYNPDGKLLKRKIVRTTSIAGRINARKELDRMLGNSNLMSIGEVKAANINIMIVDSGRKNASTAPIEVASDGNQEC